MSHTRLSGTSYFILEKVARGKGGPCTAQCMYGSHWAGVPGSRDSYFSFRWFVRSPEASVGLVPWNGARLCSFQMMAHSQFVRLSMADISPVLLCVVTKTLWMLMLMSLLGDLARSFSCRKELYSWYVFIFMRFYLKLV